jgi:hypothetical protein
MSRSVFRSVLFISLISILLSYFTTQAFIKLKAQKNDSKPEIDPKFKFIFNGPHIFFSSSVCTPFDFVNKNLLDTRKRSFHVRVFWLGGEVLEEPDKTRTNSNTAVSFGTTRGYLDRNLVFGLLDMHRIISGSYILVVSLVKIALLEGVLAELVSVQFLRLSILWV